MNSIRLFLSLMLLISSSCFANVHLSNIFQSNMVLQRDKDCAIWGYAAIGEKVAVRFDNQVYATVAGQDGKWKVTLARHAAGGPYQISIVGNNTITLDNILFGDVWVCGGQSNMQFAVDESMPKEKDSIRNNLPQIRIFTAYVNTDYVPRDTLNGGEWKVASVATIQRFSAVAYYFGRALHEKTNVPIGLISDNLGATAVETWMSPDAIKAFSQFDAYHQQYLAPKKSFATLTSDFEKTKSTWEKAYYLKGDPGIEKKWYLPETDISDWKTIETPGYWEEKGIGEYDGSVWFRRTFDLPASYDHKGYYVGIGQVDDYNTTWVNGHQVGETFGNVNYSNYIVPDSLLKEKGNVIVIRVVDAGGKGGIYTQFWHPEWAGKWNYKLGKKIDPAKFKRPDVVNSDLFNSPSILFNGCIAPISQLSIKGAIWYQGESNASRAEEYRTLFPAFITDWRKQFNQGDFPFFFVQLANFYGEDKKPEESDWAELRESQAAALSLPNTGMASAIDLGEAFDIHPKNKLDVGKRLALAALKVSYNADSIDLGPTYDHMSQEGDNIIIHFKATKSLIKTNDKYGYVRGFSIAGADSVFHYANAYIRNNEVVVNSRDVKSPIAVRYAWANNPGTLDLYNQEGLPALPFRTDSWRMKTHDRKFDFKK